MTHNQLRVLKYIMDAGGDVSVEDLDDYFQPVGPRLRASLKGVIKESDGRARIDAESADVARLIK